jgi:hypothetical protein
MDVAQLREILKPLIVNLKDMETHERLPILCAKLGMPSPDFDGSKRDRMRATGTSERRTLGPDEALFVINLAGHY